MQSRKEQADNAQHYVPVKTEVSPYVFSMESNTPKHISRGKRRVIFKTKNGLWKISSSLDRLYLCTTSGTGVELEYKRIRSSDLIKKLLVQPRIEKTGISVPANDTHYVIFSIDVKGGELIGVNPEKSSQMVPPDLTNCMYFLRISKEK